MGKTVIKFWRGRGYLHQEFIYRGFNSEKDTPLGNDPKLIKHIQGHYKCNIIYLNDDFTEEKPTKNAPMYKK